MLIQRSQNIATLNDFAPILNLGEEIQMWDLKSLLKNDIVKGVIIALIVVAILWHLSVFKKDIISTISTDIGTLSTGIGTLRTDIGRLRTDIGRLEAKLEKESETRRLLAVELLKSGINISAKSLVSFSGEKFDQLLSKELFTSFYKSVPLITKTNDYLDFKNKMADKGLDDKLIVKLNEDIALVGFQKREAIVKYLKAKQMPLQTIHPTLYNANSGTSLGYDFGWAITEPLEFFNLPGLKASDIIRIKLEKKKIGK